MTKSPSNCTEFDNLLLEAWNRVATDDKLGGLPSFRLLGRWLANLTYACPRPNEALDKLKIVLCAMRKCNSKALDDALKDSPILDCALPPKRSRRKELPVSEIPVVKTNNEKKADCALLDALLSIGNCITMQQFFREVAVHTCDKGALLVRITKDVLHDFQSFVEDVFSNRVTQIAMVLGREQITINDRYVKLEARTWSRAQLTLLHIKLIMPRFVWQRYVSERDYMKSMLVSQCMDDTCPVEVTESTEDLRGKSLLYQLNWFRTEIERAESENRILYEQNAQFTSRLAKIEQSIAEIQSRAAKEMICMTKELDDLRTKSADQVCLIDKLMDKIQMSMHSSKVKAVKT